MLFVFGKRAKKLRLKKVSQLIHKSEEHPNCETARVTVFFQNIIDLKPGADDKEENLSENDLDASDPLVVRNLDIGASIIDNCLVDFQCFVYKLLTVVDRMWMNSTRWCRTQD